MKLKMTTLLGVMILAVQANAGEQATFKSPMDKVNYGIGVETIRSFKQQGVEIDLDLVIQGMKDALSGQKLPFSEKELRKFMSDFQNELRQKQAVNRKLAAQDNRKKSEDFLAANKAQEGVIVLPSGLQYRVLKAGYGKKPTDFDSVECRYRGTLINGSEFDSSDPAQPSTFKVSEGIIPGWREALKLMPAGSKWQLFIPPQLAYGERGRGRDIGPNEALIFEVELLAVKPPA